MKQTALKRLWTAPQLGVLAGLGFIGLIVVATLFKIVLAILVDWAHSLKTKRERNK